MRRRVQILFTLLLLAICCRRTRGTVDVTRGEVPLPAEVDNYVSGGARVRLLMTEDEVAAALGGEPTRRKDFHSYEGLVESAWDHISGRHPGAAAARFAAGRLALIEFAPAQPSLPRISSDVARSLADNAEVVQRAVAHHLTLRDIEAVTGSSGARILWSFAYRPPNRAVASSVWAWNVDQSKALLVTESDGSVGQPVIRDGIR